MKCELKILKNGEQVNELTYTSEKDVYKVFYDLTIGKERIGYKTKYSFGYNGHLSVTQKMPVSMGDGTTNLYTYKYEFEGLNF